MSLAFVHNDSGYRYNNLGQYENAIRECTMAIELDPKYASAYNNRGASCAALGLHEQAEKDYAKARELNSKS